MQALPGAWTTALNYARDSFDRWIDVASARRRFLLVSLPVGLALPLLLPSLPAAACWALALTLAAVFVAYRRLTTALLLVGIGWSGLHLNETFQARQQFQKPFEAQVTGRVSDPVVRDGMLQFRFTPIDDLLTSRLRDSAIRVRWYRTYPELRAGQLWVLDLALKPARSRVNFNGHDPERANFARDIAALGTVQGGRPLHDTALSHADARQRARDRLGDALEGHAAAGIVMALAVADRNGLNPVAWQRYRLTGTSHLLAISGLHVGLAAVLGFIAGRALLLLLPIRAALVMGLSLPWLVGLGTAGAYALMAGLQTSTQRALLMLLALAGCRLLARHVHPWHIFGLALCVVMLFNPLAPLGAGFWLSFLAVAALIMLFAPRSGATDRWRGLLRAQVGLLVFMAPAGLYWFQQVPLAGVFMNLVAIPWVSAAVAPFAILATLLSPLDADVFRFPVFVAAEAAGLLEAVLETVVPLAEVLALHGPAPGFVLAVIAVCGSMCLLLPRGMPPRLAGALLLLPLVLPTWPRRDALRLEMLDVGQGLAVVVESRGALTLYDSGPGDAANWDMVSTVVAPALAGTARSTPDRIVISHADLDHAGGLSELRRRYPDATYLFSGIPTEDSETRCVSPKSWRAGPVHMTVLHPTSGLPYLGNDSSCVISIDAPGGRVLLTGDIGSAIEQRLVQQGLARHEVLIAPHHGSRSSSSPGFLDRVAPGVALVSAGYGNRFGLPHVDVEGRFRHIGTPLMSTADCGAIAVELRPGEPPQLKSARRRQRAIWHWPAGADCP